VRNNKCLVSKITIRCTVSGAGVFIPELEAAVSEMKRTKTGVHFWLYTNGILADDEHLDAIRALEVGEIRFNLAATDYHEKILDNLKQGIA
jgi:pyruvate formate-lyase activating enzyme-like uncharacterized protein